ncbi:MAG: RNA 3'-terminal phosphate cyclase [Sulfolobales archaeon]
MIEIDGSFGEGGGQILRYSLAISAITGREVRIFNIRAKRDNPGLQRQHLTAVNALATITRARVLGAEIGSTEIIFEPQGIYGGEYFFDIGTAGSITLVLQSLLPVLAFASSPSKIRIRGGSDVPWSPTYDYFANVFMPFLEKLGYRVSIKLIRRGHYPRGGGEVYAEILNCPKGFEPINLTERGKVLEIRGRSHAVKLPRHVAERQARSAIERLRSLGIDAPINIDIESYPPDKDPHLGPGSGISIWAISEKSLLGADSIGARDKRAEEIGEKAARTLFEDLSTGAALDRYMSDMIIPYLLFSNGISIVTGSMLTLHAYTMIEVSRKIVPEARIEYDGIINKPFKLLIKGVAKLI